MNSQVSKSERATQNRVLDVFKSLGYEYLGDWSDRANSNIEDSYLVANLNARGYSKEEADATILQLKSEANKYGRGLYANNMEVYRLLRYGVPVRTDVSKPTQLVHLIDWHHPEKNHFAIAEEVTLNGPLERRPDIVLYVNGIAIGVLELKNSRVSIGDGIRQNLSNQQPEFNAWFFSTIQFILAGNDTEGLRYGTIETEEKYFLKWKEDPDDDTGYLIDKYLIRMCRKDRIIELMHDFILFDGGVKKLPRVHQYFAIKEAQKRVKEGLGGIIWHTQGSGKSIVMVLLAKWILENNPHARVAVITDREELDKQILRVFTDAGESIKRATSGRDLIAKLTEPSPRLLCSLVHKFGVRDKDVDYEAFLKDIQMNPMPTIGEIHVFVDECHRTQSGKLHRMMKAVMPTARFIGFTGTPLLKEDKPTTREVFGTPIHTYKFNEAVEDKVILDLVYEARDIDQELTSEDRIDQWFEAKTRALNDWQKQALKKQWGTLQSVLSSKSRMIKVVADIQFDFSTKPRLSSERGNAMLVTSSIYEASRYYELFQQTPLKGKCGLITSYNPNASDVTLEETGANSETDKQALYNTYQDILERVNIEPGKSRTEVYEDWAKDMFIKQPARMKLLIVVEKLLTGFDAPPCTFIYLDKSMQDHGLFQAICRTNRLDGEDKTFGYVVDYKDLFNKVKDSIQVYTSELDDESGETSEIMLEERVNRAKERFDSALEQMEYIVEPVPMPKGDLEHIRYFCGNTENPYDLDSTKPLREALYKMVASLVRSYADIADDLVLAGYSPAQIKHLKERVLHFTALRELIRKASGEYLDLKAYEADMRFLIDTYIQAYDSRTISPFENISLLELIQKTGIDVAIGDRLGGLGGNKTAVAEVIENNVRSKIIKEQLNDPAFYSKMSELLDKIIAARKAEAIKYEEYLKLIAKLASTVQEGLEDDTPEPLKKNPAMRAIYNTFKVFNEIGMMSMARDFDEGYGDTDPILRYAERIHHVIITARQADWRGNRPKEMKIKQALYVHLQDEEAVEELFNVIRQRSEY